MVYTALQLITRGRERGISVVELGKKTRYDQKTCFYLVKQLLELDLVVKLRQGGVGANFCVHRYFFERNTLWRQIRNEEAQGSGDEEQLPDQPLEMNDDGGKQGFPAGLSFEPIDGRHLSSLALVQSRIVKLLKHSPHNMH